MVERLTALGAERIGVIGNTPTLRGPRAQRQPAAVQRETGAGYFVFGQVQDDDAGVRLVVHLIRLDDDTHLWVTRVARAPSDLADIQDVVADRLAEAVRRHVIDRDPEAPRFTR
jgi:TolB-like protein